MEASKKILIASMIGNVVEWYDFALFGYFAPIIARLFFPSDNHLVSLVNTFGVFAAGFLVRPIGGAIFGHFGDTAGRKKALAASVLLMAIPTFLIGLLPTYAQIGVLAPVLLTVLRLLQGLSVGGEYTGSIIFLVESAPQNQRGYVGSWIPVGTCLGILLGSGTGALFTSDLSHEALYSWGWRIPFLLGLGVGVAGLYMRSGLGESPDFENLRTTGSVSPSPLREVWTNRRREIATAVGLTWVSGATFYVVFMYLTTYLAGILKFPLGDALTINTISMVILAPALPIMGMWSDRIGRKPLLMTGSLSLLLLSYPLFRLLAHDTFGFILAGQVIFGLLLAVYFGPLPAALVELFPPRERASGLSIGYNLAIALFGGTAPLIATFLIKETGDSLSPSFYLILCAAVSLATVLSLPDRAPSPSAPAK